MILTVYATLFAISLALLFLGYYSKVDVIKVLGYGIIFTLSFFMLSYGGTLEYKTGEIITNNMACGGCADTRFSTNTTNATNIYIASINTVDTYTTYENKTLGFLMGLIGFFGWLSVYFDYKSRGNNE